MIFYAEVFYEYNYYCGQLPLSPVKVTRENVRFAAQLSSAFGGSGGEFGTIAEYVFQSVIFRSCNLTYKT